MSHSVPAHPLVQLDRLQLALESNSGSVTILHDVSLRVHAGETLCVTGPSGSGKTSLLMVIAGLEKATGGSARVKGKDMATAREDDLARFRGRHIGIVFQSFHLVPTMTAIENVAVPLDLLGERNAFARAQEALDAVGLAHRREHYPSQLSGGERQRVAIARATVARPPLLLADEPTGNLDHDTGAHVMDELFSLQLRHGMTLILVTHDAALAQRCQRQIRLVDGRIAG